MAWLGGLALVGLAACALWALWDLLRTRIIRAQASGSALGTSRRTIVLWRLLMGAIVGAVLAVLGLAVFLLVIDLQA